ncbi:MAG: hypothetical protein ACREQY_03835 [Candidatus Binatia bacterium]
MPEPKSTSSHASNRLADDVPRQRVISAVGSDDTGAIYVLHANKLYVREDGSVSIYAG